MPEYDGERETSPPVAEDDPRIGSRVGDLILEAEVAGGAVGRVYSARHAVTGERVAVKILREELAQEPVAVERFKREYETAFGLAHPHIVQVREFGQASDGAHFMTMELLDGEPLSSVLAREGALAPERALRIACQMASALEHAHSFGVIHRDLKPANIFLVDTDEGDFVKLLDFGSVKLQLEMGPKLTGFGMTLGSPSYMSPEQAEGVSDLDHRADVFALAAVTYEMLAGAVAFDGADGGAVLANILRGRPVPVSERNPALPLGIDLVISAGLKRDKASRTGSAREFAEALLRVFGLEEDLERYASLPEREWNIPRRGRSIPERSGKVTPSRSEVEPPPPRAPSPRGAIWLGMGLAAAAISAVVLYLLA